MPKATKDIYAVPEGEIYPVAVKKGDEIPANMLAVAESLGATPKGKEKAKK